ncbi:hypothetical protein ASPZODRAFT_125479 [Penicilliopsis zonata CBS 506.65]|uniref:Major facilitator superfamily (MFS) profile domain-containing protein n=1 Tax=Penicilliopsis zonata CBS 506.65 TaxID=1073090 RepID=A0A1L9S5N9_9EURO|nr:hypothetical protein ASPZODRAFT_125479 [Penicilliopsis zonata CBS 506.65]OJJ42472.1 hypothetical protein ASPZODRAFT_125479 [Penicilliopsis zonata CBS 506.65]
MKLFMVLLIVQCNGTILGIENILLGNLVGVQSFCRVMGSWDESTSAYAVAAGTLSLWAGVYSIAQIIGNLSAGWVADRFGRSKALFTFIVIIYLGVMTEILSKNKNDFTGAKIIMGIGNGMNQVATTTFVAEATPREIRGITIGLYWLTSAIGNLFCTLVIYGCNQAWGSNAFDDRAWKVPLYIGLSTPTITLILMLLLMPESPSWLILKDRVEDAKKSLHKLYPRRSVDEINRMTHELQYTVYKERELRDAAKSASWLDCFKGVNRLRTFCAIFPSLSTQFAGTQLINTYSTYFFEIAHLDNSLEASVIVYVVGIVASIIAFALMDMPKIGRWPLLFYGLIIMTVMMLAIAIVDSVGNPASAGSGNAFVVFLAIFYACSVIGPGVAGWAYAGETGSATLRAKTATLSMCSNALVGGVFNIVIPYELDAIGPKSGYMFFGLGAIALVFVYLWVPEVTGRTYAQLNELFERRVPPRQFKTTECTGDYGNGEA